MRGEIESIIHSELRMIRQRSQISAVAPAASTETATPAQTPPAVQPLPFDYGRFAERFRGDESYVKAGQQFYLPYFEGCRNVLDIGCGRGEFLKMMRDAGIPAKGIELGPESVAFCKSEGLDVELADAFTYLASLPEESL